MSILGLPDKILYQITDRYSPLELIGTALSFVEGRTLYQTTSNSDLLSLQKLFLIFRLSLDIQPLIECWKNRKATLLFSTGGEKILWSGRNFIFILQAFFATATIYGIVKSILKQKQISQSLPENRPDIIKTAPSNLIYYAQIILKVVLSIFSPKRELHLMNAALCAFNLYHSPTPIITRFERTFASPPENQELTESDEQGIFWKQRVWQEEVDKLTLMKDIFNRQANVLNTAEIYGFQSEIAINQYLEIAQYAGTQLRNKSLENQLLLMKLLAPENYARVLLKLMAMRPPEMQINATLTELHSFSAQDEQQLERLKNQLQYIIKKVTFTYEFLLFPYVGSDACAICSERKKKFYFCPSHAFDLECLTSWINAKSTEWLHKSVFSRTVDESSNVVKNYEISLSKENIPSCPECRQNFAKQKLNVSIQHENQKTKKIETLTGEVPLESSENPGHVTPMQYFLTCLEQIYTVLVAGITRLGRQRPELMRAFLQNNLLLITRVKDVLYLLKDFLEIHEILHRKYVEKEQSAEQFQKKKLYLLAAESIGIFGLWTITLMSVIIYNLRLESKVNLTQLLQDVLGTSTKFKGRIHWDDSNLQYLTQCFYLHGVFTNLILALLSPNRTPYLVSAFFNAFNLSNVSQLYWLKITSFFEMGSEGKNDFITGVTFFDFFVPSDTGGDENLPAHSHLKASLKMIHDYATTWMQECRLSVVRTNNSPIPKYEAIIPPPHFTSHASPILESAHGFGTHPAWKFLEILFRFADQKPG